MLSVVVQEHIVVDPSLPKNSEPAGGRGGGGIRGASGAWERSERAGGGGGRGD